MPGKLNINRADDYGFYPRLGKATGEQEQAAIRIAGASPVSRVTETGGGAFTSAFGPDYYLIEITQPGKEEPFVEVDGAFTNFFTFVSNPSLDPRYVEEVKATAYPRLVTLNQGAQG